jgi:hypothetical protein
MDAWKRKNTAREVKGLADASLRADLKSKASQATKNEAGEFQMRKPKRGRDMLTQTVAGAKKGKPAPKQAPTATMETEVAEEARKG